MDRKRLKELREDEKNQIAIRRHYVHVKRDQEEIITKAKKDLDKAFANLIYQFDQISCADKKIESATEIIKSIKSERQSIVLSPKIAKLKKILASLKKNQEDLSGIIDPQVYNKEKVNV